MRKLLVPAAAAAILATSAVAFAATHTTAGIVKSYDSKSMTLTLDNGNAFAMPKGFKDPGLRTGERVSIAWDAKNGSKVAEKVMIVK